MYTFWRLIFTKVTRFRAPKMPEKGIFRIYRFSKLISRKIYSLFGLCQIHSNSCTKYVLLIYCYCNTPIIGNNLALPEDKSWPRGQTLKRMGDAFLKWFRKSNGDVFSNLICLNWGSPGVKSAESGGSFSKNLSLFP